jgi:hypothetical protein
LPRTHVGDRTPRTPLPSVPESFELNEISRPRVDSVAGGRSGEDGLQPLSAIGVVRREARVRSCGIRVEAASGRSLGVQTEASSSGGNTVRSELNRAFESLAVRNENRRATECEQAPFLQTGKCSRHGLSRCSDQLGNRFLAQFHFEIVAPVILTREIGIG